jgi:hypothetical protein
MKDLGYHDDTHTKKTPHSCIRECGDSSYYQKNNPPRANPAIKAKGIAKGETKPNGDQNPNPNPPRFLGPRGWRNTCVLLTRIILPLYTRPNLSRMVTKRP